jgi:hypothetical protein
MIGDKGFNNLSQEGDTESREHQGKWEVQQRRQGQGRGPRGLQENHMSGLAVRRDNVIFLAAAAAVTNCRTAIAPARILPQNQQETCSWASFLLLDISAILLIALPSISSPSQTQSTIKHPIA